jgi:C1A family cysteine protease
MKRLVSKFTIVFIAISLLNTSCEKNTESPKNSLLNSTGWLGSDNTATVPLSLDNPFAANSSTLPAFVDLSQYLPPVGDQGQYGTCVAWATAYNCKTALEAIKFNISQAQLRNPAYQLSPRYLFTVLPDNLKGDNCGGTDFTPALELMLSQGVATKATVPYENLGNCAQNLKDPSWDADAAKHKIKYYRRLDADLNTIKQTLASKIPVILGAKLDDSFMRWNSETVYQNATSFENTGIHAYHAMCIIGYDDYKGPRGAFRVVNSWSENWGSNGYIWVDYNFMFNGFSFNNNFFMTTNDDQKPEENDNPNPPPSSEADIVPWVVSDFANTDLGPTGREMYFNIYNVGKQTAPASIDWGYAYLYYNAFDANDYGIIFYDVLTNTEGPYKSITNYENQESGFNGLMINCNISGGSSLGNELFESDTLSRTYTMPSGLNGSYYLVVFGDVTDKFTAESDESNNLFYTTSQFPLYFTNGVGLRRDVQTFHFSNPEKSDKLLSKQANQLRTAVHIKNRNAYSPQEIIRFLKNEVQTGRLAKKISIAKAESTKNRHFLTTVKK